MHLCSIQPYASKACTIFVFFFNIKHLSVYRTLEEITTGSMPAQSESQICSLSHVLTFYARFYIAY